jgi:pimeloyl-ACP methyl ester carboxylesterase
MVRTTDAARALPRKEGTTSGSPRPATLVATTGGVLVAAAVGVPVVGRWLGFAPPDPPPPGRMVSIGRNLELNVFDQGSGPPVVLVHGLPGSAYDWGALPLRLNAAGFRVIRFDRLGYGHSSRRPAGAHFGMFDNARDLLALLDALELERAVLVGWSYGGGIAQLTALTAPHRVARLVLVATVGPAWAGPAESPGAAVAGNRLLQRWILHSGLARILAAREASAAFAPHAVPPGWLERTLALLALPGALHTWWSEGHEYSAEDLDPSFPLPPLLALHGTADRLVAHSVARDLTRRIQEARLVSIAGGGHMLPVTHADRISDEVRRFLGPHLA